MRSIRSSPKMSMSATECGEVGDEVDRGDFVKSTSSTSPTTYRYPLNVHMLLKSLISIKCQTNNAFVYI